MRKGWFKNTNIPQATIEQMFETVSFSLDNLPKLKDTLGYGDFEFLKDRPYFLFNGEMYMLDYEFALGKLESAVIWRVLRNLPDNKKDPWLSYWGLIFEEYVTWMFETYAHPTLYISCIPTRCTSNSTDQICDQIVICGDTAVLIEAKLATCTAASLFRRLFAGYGIPGRQARDRRRRMPAFECGENHLRGARKTAGLAERD